MATDHFEFDRWKSFRAESGRWYEAVELLGVGGNAATFLARCTTAPLKGTLYAVKVFRKLSKPERKESFLRESRFLQDCAHPAVLRVYDVGEYYDNPFVVCEYLPQTLGNAFRRGLTLARKVSLSIQLVSALTYLESLDPAVVHRDIKPSNIFVKGESCVLGDFGLLKRLDGQYESDKEVLKESVGVGMPRSYRTPDLVDYLNGVAELTVKTDVFQLGLVLVQLFTGTNPCKPSASYSDPVTLERIAEIPGEFAPSVGGLLHRMLRIIPAERPAASELIDGWQGLFKGVVDKTIELEGRAFRSQ